MDDDFGGTPISGYQHMDYGEYSPVMVDKRLWMRTIWSYEAKTWWYFLQHPQTAEKKQT